MLRGIATELHVTPLNAWLTMENGTVKVIEAVDGQDVDVAALSGQMEPLFATLQVASLDVPLIVTEAAVQVEDHRTAQTQAETMLSAPITLVNRDKEYTLSAEQIASWLDFRTEYENGVPRLIPYIAEVRMWWFLNDLASAGGEEARQRAVHEQRDQRPGHPGRRGRDARCGGHRQARERRRGRDRGRTVDVAVNVIEPDFTTAEAEATTFDDQLSSYTTKYVGSTNRQANVRVTTKYATNVFLAPGSSTTSTGRSAPAPRPAGTSSPPASSAPTPSRTFWAAASARYPPPCSTRCSSPA